MTDLRVEILRVHKAYVSAVFTGPSVLEVIGSTNGAVETCVHELCHYAGLYTRLPKKSDTFSEQMVAMDTTLARRSAKSSDLDEAITCLATAQILQQLGIDSPHLEASLLHYAATNARCGYNTLLNMSQWKRAHTYANIRAQKVLNWLASGAIMNIPIAYR